MYHLWEIWENSQNPFSVLSDPDENLVKCQVVYSVLGPLCQYGRFEPMELAAFYERGILTQVRSRVLSFIMGAALGNSEDLMVWRWWNPFLRKICLTRVGVMDFLPEIGLTVSPCERHGTPLKVVQKYNCSLVMGWKVWMLNSKLAFLTLAWVRSPFKKILKTDVIETYKNVIHLIGT